MRGRWAAAALPALPEVAEACAACVGWGSDGRTDGAFLWSGLLLTLLPFLLLGLAGAWVARLLRGSARECGGPTGPEAAADGGPAAGRVRE